MRQIILSLLLIHLAACSSMQTVPVGDLPGDGDNAPLQVGDRIELVTYDREKLEFAVTDITADGLGGKFGFIPYKDIRSVRVQRPGRSDKNTHWVWTALGAAVLIALIAGADSVSACSPGPCPQPSN
jgi:hypothetical protein